MDGHWGRAEYRAKVEEMCSLTKTAPNALTSAEYPNLAQSWDELARPLELADDLVFFGPLANRGF